jgi:hypothetical protein
MGQKLHLIKKDKYRLNITAYIPEFEAIRKSESNFNYRFSIKEKFSEPALESFEANVLDEKVGFDLMTKLNFGTYLYVIEKINVTKENVDDLAFGFIEILPDV